MARQINNGPFLTDDAGLKIEGVTNPDGTPSKLQFFDRIPGNKLDQNKLGGVFAGNAYQSLLLIGDSLNARMGNAFSALGGWSATVSTITPTGGPTVAVGFSAAHNIPAGQRVRISSDATTNPEMRNRWFDFTSTGSTTGILSVPADAKDKAYMEYALSNTVAFSGSAELSIDAVRGFTGSYMSTLFALGDPFDEVNNLCIPGAKSGEDRFTDTLAYVKTLDLTQFTHVGITVGINDMAQGVLGPVTLKNIIEIAERCLDAGCFVCIDEVYPQGTMDAAKQTFLQVVNPGLHAYAATRANVVITPTREIINDASNVGSTIDLSDGTHLNAIGAMKIGLARAKVWAQQVKRRYSPAFQASVKNYAANPTFEGTGGTVTGPSTGVAADSWTIAAPGANVTCVGRKHRRRAIPWRFSTPYALGDVVIPTTANGLYYVCTTNGTSGASAPTWGAVAWATTTDNTATWTAFPSALFAGDNARGYWQYVQGIVGGTSGSQERIILQQTITLASVGLAAGDWIRGRVNIKLIDSNFAFAMVALRTGSVVGSAFSFSAGGGKNSLLTAVNQPENTIEGLMVSDWYRIPAGQTTMTFLVECGCTTGYENSTMRLFVTDAVVEKRSY